MEPMYAVFNTDTFEFEVIGDLAQIERYITELVSDGTSPTDIEIWERRDDYRVEVKTIIITPETPKFKKGKQS